MTARKPLRVVQADEAAAKSKPLSVTDAVKAGSYRDELVATRLRIAQAVDDPSTPAQALAALTRRQLEISKEINAIDSAANGDQVSAAAATADEAWAAN